MYKNKHLAIICQNSRLPFIFEEAREMGIKVTFFFHSQESMPRELPVVSRYIGIDLFNSPEEALLEVKKVYEQDPFNGVITLFEPALAFTARVAQELNLRFLPLETILSCRNKNETRKILKENNLHTPVFYEIHSDQDLLSIDCAFPMVVKPSNGFSSQGVVRVNTYEELLEAVRKVEEINKHDLSQFVQNEAKIIVEQFIDGPEFAIESFSIQGEVHILSIGYKGDCKGPYFEEGVYIAPAQLDETIQNAIVQEVKGAIKALGITDGPSHTELRLHHGKIPYVIEIGARIGGSGISHYIVKESTGVNYIRLAISNAFDSLDKDTIDQDAKPFRVAGNYIIPVQGSGIFERIDGLDELNEMSEVVRVFQFIDPGTAILPYPHFSGYPGFILTTHDSYEECAAFYRYLDNYLKLEYKNNVII